MITLYLIEGTLMPRVLTCKAEARELACPSPQLNHKERIYNLQEYIHLNKNFDSFFSKHNPMYWKQRMWTYMVLSQYILSLTFLPENRSKCSLLFLQKKEADSKIIGFVAPYLCKKDQKKYSATKAPPPFYLVQSDQAISQSISWMEEVVRPSIQQILECFLQDGQTNTLSITFLNGKDYVTCGYYKKAL